MEIDTYHFRERLRINGEDEWEALWRDKNNSTRCGREVARMKRAVKNSCEFEPWCVDFVSFPHYLPEPCLISFFSLHRMKLKTTRQVRESRFLFYCLSRILDWTWACIQSRAISSESLERFPEILADCAQKDGHVTRVLDNITGESKSIDLFSFR